MVYLKYIFVMVLFSSALIANVTALKGGVDRTNKLNFISDENSLQLNVEGNFIELLTTDSSLIIDKSFTLKNTTTQVGKKLFDIYLKQTSKSHLKSVSYEYSESLQTLTSREIKKTLSRYLGKKLKEKSNYLSHQIIKITVPEDSTESIDIDYKISYKPNNKKIRVFSYKQLLSVLLNSSKPAMNLKQNFIIQYKKRYFIAEMVVTKDSDENPITQNDVRTKHYAVNIIEELHLYKNKIDNIFSNRGDNSIFELTMSDSLPLSLSILDNDVNLVKFNLVSIENEDTYTYMNEEKKRAVSLNNFDFSEEPIWANFKIKTSHGMQYLKTDYKMVGKRKNIVQVSLNGNSAVLNPQSKSTKKLTHNAYIVDIKTFLFEMKKILKENGKTKLKWTQKVKQSMLGLMYKDSDGKMVKKKISRGRKQFYDIAGLWYLISWSAENNIDMKSFLFMKEDFPFEAQYSRTPYGYLVSQRGVEIFRFYLDEYNRIIKVIDVENDITITLTKKGYINDSIKKNIEFLDNYLTKHNLQKVD